MPSQVRGRRRRRNELRRRSDVVQTWSALVLGALLVCGVPAAAWAAGHSMYVSARDQAAAQAAERRPVRAELLRDAPESTPEVRGMDSHPEYPVTVRWTAADGSPASGTAEVEEGLRAGETTRIWVDAQERVAPAPMETSEVWSRTLTTAIFAAVALALLAGAAHLVVRLLLQRVRLAAWERAWARTGPEWSSHLR
ncbi:hypothetical protein H9Y04_33190 [Streptomyces sp. TRM66268-LWL]|uniref:Integral membrane protein n=1 Tax=Streptomyces polyasparticus TaxID=2767826 RepID=A0ABR7SPI0_9ACTN|nr:hypothetical protein [Streptomyces polyasparticus]MBC9717396.1 hypothetical protein [Streptomyces polyasparticus]